MRGVQEARSAAGVRARRWDAVVLGGALPGLVAAARLGMQGLRVLVIEEEGAAKAFAGLREPFLLPGGGAGGVLDACLRDLTVPLIDRKKIEFEPVALQVVMPGARVDVGEPQITAEEWVSWGLAKPEEARLAVRALQEAANAERAAMLEAPIVKSGGLRGLARGGAPRSSRHGRGLPAELASPPPALAPVLDAQVRALSNLGATAPPPEARARLLGAALEGGASFASSDGFLRGLLRRRIQALFGEFRLVSGRFDLVTVGDHPGVAPQGTNEVYVGRALILNAPRSALAAALAHDGAQGPEFLDGAPPTRRRVTLHMRAHRGVLPEAMARRVIRVTDPSRPLEGANLVAIATYPCATASDAVELAASAVMPLDGGQIAPDAEDAIEAVVRELLPFSEGRLVRGKTPPPRWDDDSPLLDPAVGEGWPGEAEIRLASRPAIYGLPREAVGALGAEGDVLLGWRAGDAIRADLG